MQLFDITVCELFLQAPDKILFTRIYLPFIRIIEYSCFNQVRRMVCLNFNDLMLNPSSVAVSFKIVLN